MPAKVWPLTWVCSEPWGFSLAAWFQDCCCVPGVRRISFVKLRSRLGSSVTCLVSRITETSARSVLRSWPSAAFTVTASVSWPMSSRKSTLVWLSTFTRTEGITDDLKPLSSALTS